MKFVKLQFLFFLFFLTAVLYSEKKQPPLHFGEFNIKCYTTYVGPDHDLNVVYTGSVSMSLYKVISWGNGVRDCVVQNVGDGSWTSTRTLIQAFNYSSDNYDIDDSYIFNHIIGLNGEQRYCLVIEDYHYIYFTAGDVDDKTFVLTQDSNNKWKYKTSYGDRNSDILSTSEIWGETTLRVQNSFGAGTMLVNDIPYNHNTVLNVISNSTHKLEKVDYSINENTKQAFVNWNDQTPESIKYSTITNPTTVIANFELRNRLTIQTSFGVEGTGGGIVNVDQVDYSVPTIDLFFKNDKYNLPVTAPLQQVKNEVWCNFDRWSDGIMSNSRTVNMNSPQTVTAQYVPSVARLAPMNARIEGVEGDYVKVNWDEHTNSNVSQYKVWRKLKNGTEDDLGTLGRGYTEVTDYTYKIKYGSDATTLFYAVTPYYAPSGVWSPLAYDLTTGEYMQFEPKRLADNFAEAKAEKETPSDYSVESYPNPFNPTTTINYQLPKDGVVTIKVYDIIGKEVATLVNGQKNAGYYKVDFDASKLTSGVYIATIQASSFNKSIKLLLTK
ncbi:MAG: T9SS type A sorting domain-containing protein [Melioribacteraceae bacterium]